MRKNRGFTLIEVMVVLSILALVAILAYNFFGNPMKEARLSQQVTKLHNDLRIISDAYESYFLKYGTTPLPVLGGGVEILQNYDLVSTGALKANPVPDDAVYDKATSFADDYDLGTWVGEDVNGDGVTGDVIAGLSNVNEDVCVAYNEKYTSIVGSYLYGSGPDYPVGVSTYCLCWAAPCTSPPNLMLAYIVNGGQ